MCINTFEYTAANMCALIAIDVHDHRFYRRRYLYSALRAHCTVWIVIDSPTQLIIPITSVMLQRETQRCVTYEFDG